MGPPHVEDFELEDIKPVVDDFDVPGAIADYVAEKTLQHVVDSVINEPHRTFLASLIVFVVFVAQHFNMSICDYTGREGLEPSRFLRGRGLRPRPRNRSTRILACRATRARKQGLEAGSQASPPS